MIKNKSAQTLISALAWVGVGLGLTANYGIAPLNNETSKPLASQLKDRLAPGDMVVAYGTYWQDLPVYLDRTITVVDWTGELSFGVEHYPLTHEWMIPADTFWQRCATATHAVYVFINEEGFKALPTHDNCDLHIIAESGKTLLLEKSIKN